MGIGPEVASFDPQMGQKPQRAQWGPPRMTKIIFSSFQDMKTLILEKRIFELSSIQKNWCDHTMAMAAILDFWALGHR